MTTGVVHFGGERGHHQVQETEQRGTNLGQEFKNIIDVKDMWAKIKVTMDTVDVGHVMPQALLPQHEDRTSWDSHEVRGGERREDQSYGCKDDTF